jgi:hypothetical protein
VPLDLFDRSDIAALNERASRVTGIPTIAEKIING